MSSQLFRKKTLEQLTAEADESEKRLPDHKKFGVIGLAALGIGAIIGTGIFILTGTAAAGEDVRHSSLLKAPLLDVLLHGSQALSTSGRPGAGPAIALSFLLVALVCGLAALCYAELASMIPVAGSAYTYTYATLGELFAWIIGWDLILEYAFGAATVAVGWSGYVVSLLRDTLHINYPLALSKGPWDEITLADGTVTHGVINLPGLLIAVAVT
ncbi:MAG TPA: amino acid permease, partial [Polyangia bacterium]|nr:amino acid permease [Polyangia bacterium]